MNKLMAMRKTRQPKIGSIKNDKVNYDKEEQFFSKEDIPMHARTIKEEINQLVDPDHLGLRKKEWNTSVSVPKTESVGPSDSRRLSRYSQKKQGETKKTSFD